MKLGNLIDPKKKERIRKAIENGDQEAFLQKKTIHDTIRDQAVLIRPSEKQAGGRTERNNGPKDNKRLNERLITCAKNGRIRDVLDALDAGADVNYVNDFDVKDTIYSTILQQAPALVWAADEGHTEVVRLLLSKGADINATDLMGQRTALMFAAQKGSKEIVDLLLKAPGVDVNAKTKDGSSAFWCARRHGHSDIVELLIQHGARL